MFRNELLADTVRNAAQYKPYDALWARSPKDRDGACAFHTLPMVTKEAFWSVYEENFAKTNASFATINHTSATTGRMRFRYRTEDEIRTTGEFFAEIANELGDRIETDETNATSERPIMLELATSAHGNTPTDGRANGGAFVIPVDARWPPEAIELLTKEFRVPGLSARVSSLTGSPKRLMILTRELIARGHTPADFKVNGLYTFSDYVARGQREFLENWWKCRVFDAFSMSEVWGASRACVECRAFGEFEPTVFAEFVHPTTREPVSKGLSVLVLTELYPFTQFAPLVRYWTGDLVERVDGCGECGDEPFLFRGRLSTCVRDEADPAHPILLTGSQILDAAADVDYIERDTGEWMIVGARAGAGPELPIGNPRISAALEIANGKRLVRVRFMYRTHTAYSSRLNRRAEDDFRQALLEESPQLAARVASGECELRVEATSEALTPFIS